MCALLGDQCWAFQKRDVSCCPNAFCNPERQQLEYCNAQSCKAQGIPKNFERNFGKETDKFTICYGKGFIGGAMTDSYVGFGDAKTAIPLQVGAGQTASSMFSDFKNTNGVCGLGPQSDKISQPLVPTLHEKHPDLVPAPIFAFDLSKESTQLWIGGHDPAWTQDGSKIHWATTNSNPFMKYWWVVPGTLGYSLDDGTIGPAHKGNLIFDSGTTDMMLSPALFRDFKRQVCEQSIFLKIWTNFIEMISSRF